MFKKRVLSLLLVLAMMLSMIPVIASAETETPEIKSAQLVLNSVLSLNITVDLKGNDPAEYTMDVTIGESATQSITSTGNVYTAKVMAHQMLDTIQISLKQGDAVVASVQNWTIKTYVDAINDDVTVSDEVKTLATAMYQYGQYAAYYKNGGEDPAIDTVTNTTVDKANKLELRKTSAGLGAVAYLYLDEACDLGFKFNAAAMEGLTLYVDYNAVEATAVSDTQVGYKIPEILPQNYDVKHTIQVKSGEELVFDLSYSVLSYVYTWQNKSSSQYASLIGLLKSMQVYGTAAEDYLASQSASEAIDYALLYNFEMLNCFNSTSASNSTAWNAKVAQLAGTDVDVITLTPSFYRTNLWQSTVDTHWTDYATTQETTDNAIYERIKAYMLAGGDPLQDMLDIYAANGYDTVFINYRMNDKHNTSDPTYATHNQFYLEHSEYWLNADSTSDNRTLNYMEEEVRDYYFGLLEELVTNYDVDGLELDFQRAPIFFASDKIAEGTEVMTAFVGRIRTMLDEVGTQKGKYLPLSVRVPATVSQSLSVGLDVAAWAANGYIDMVNVTSGYYNTMSVDIEGYKTAVGSEVKVYGELNYVVDQSKTDTSQRVYATAENLRATAENFYARGVDGLSAFNMDYSGNKAVTFAALTGITDSEALSGEEKHYAFKSGYDFTVTDDTASVTAILSVDAETHNSALLRVATAQSSISSTLTVTVNGTVLEAAELRTLTDGTELFPRLADTAAYASADQLHYYTLPVEQLVNGENTIQVQRTAGEACTISMIEVGIYHADSAALQGTTSTYGGLLSNGNFVKGSTSWSSNVRKDLSAEATVSYPENGGVDNTQYVLLDMTNTGTQDGAVQLTQNMGSTAIGANRVYRLTFAAKVSGADSVSFSSIRLRDDGDTATWLGISDPVVINSADWATYTVDITARTAHDASKLLFFVAGELENVQLYLDNISLVEVPLETYTVTLPTGDGYTVTGDTQAIQSMDYTFTVTPNNAATNITAYANGEAITAGDDGSYTVSNVQSDLTITVDANLLQQGDFNTAWGAWSIPTASKNNSSFTKNWETDGGVDGSRYVKLDITSSGTSNGSIQIYQTMESVNLTEGKTYRLTFWAKVTGAETLTFGNIRLRNNETTAGWPGTVSNVTITGEQWAQYTVDVPADFSSTGSRIFFNLAANQSNVQLHLDNIVLVELAGPYGVTLTEGEGYTLIGDTTVKQGEDYTFTLTMADGYSQSTPVVKVNGQELAGENGTYTVSNVTADLVITVEGLEKNVYTVTLPTGDGYAITTEQEATVAHGESYTFTVTPNHSATNITVTTNVGTVTGEENVYTVSDITDHLVIEVDANLLAGGDFETSSSNWKRTVNSNVNIGGAGSITTASGDAVNGKYTNIVIQNVGTQVNAFEFRHDMAGVNVEVGESYKLTFAAKVNNAQAISIGRIWFRDNTANSSLANEESIVVDGTEWAVYTCEFTVTTANATDSDSSGFRLVFQLGGEGIVTGAAEDETAYPELHLDNINLVKLAPKTYTVTLPTGDGYAAAGNTEVTQGEDYTFTVTPNNAATNITAYANGEAVTAGDDGSYTVSNVQSDLTITVDANMLTYGDLETGMGDWKISVKTDAGASASKERKTSGGVDDSAYISLYNITNTGTSDGNITRHL